MIGPRARTATKYKSSRVSERESTPPAAWLAHVIQEQTCGDGDKSLVVRIAWRHCPLTLCCLPAGLLWTFAISATLSKAQTSAVAQGKTALHALVGSSVGAVWVLSLFKVRILCLKVLRVQSFSGRKNDLNHNLSQVPSLCGAFNLASLRRYSDVKCQPR